MYFFAAQENLALNKPAVQYTTYDGAVASRANDGDASLGSCTSNGGNNPWWSVDLEAPYDVERVIVTNDAHAIYGNWSRTYFVDSSSTTRGNINK